MMIMHTPNDNHKELQILRTLNDAYINKILKMDKVLQEIKKQHIETLEYALKCMLVNDFIEDCIPVVKIKSEIARLKGEVE